MKENFEKILPFVFDREKYLSYDPVGGHTVWGVAEKYHSREFPALLNMSAEDAKVRATEIYKTEYWNKCNCDNLLKSFDMLIFDTAVNQGCKKAMEIFSKSDGTEFDFIICRIRAYCDINNQEYLKGWILRVLDLWEYVKNV